MVPTDGWTTITRDDHPVMARAFAFPDFASALAFAVRVGMVAEKLDHHPDLRVSWGQLVVETWTHATGGLTERDHALAKAIDALA